MQQDPELTNLLQGWQRGDPDALERLAPYVYDELRRLARQQMLRENPGHTLQATALVNEAFMKLAGVEIDYQSRRHFLNTASQIMRRLLVDHARGRQREKRGGKARDLTLDEGVHVTEEDLPQILELDMALDKLTAINERLSQAVQLIYFGGLSYDEAAELLGMSRTSFYEDLKFAKAWLRRELASLD